MLYNIYQERKTPNIIYPCHPNSYLSTTSEKEATLSPPLHQSFYQMQMYIGTQDPESEGPADDPLDPPGKMLFRFVEELSVASCSDTSPMSKLSGRCLEKSTGQSCKFETIRRKFQDIVSKHQEGKSISYTLHKNGNCSNHNQSISEHIVSYMHKMERLNRKFLDTTNATMPWRQKLIWPSSECLRCEKVTT